MKRIILVSTACAAFLLLISPGSAINSSPCLRSCLNYEWMPLIDCQVTCSKGPAPGNKLPLDVQQNCLYERCNGNGSGTVLNQRQYISCRRSCKTTNYVPVYPEA